MSARPVLLFGSYADALGGGEIAVPVAAAGTVDAVVEYLRGLPGGDRLPPNPLVAVNQAYAASGTPLGPADEVAVIPPVAGG
jgi:molybdopterin converting factor small subunit